MGITFNALSGLFDLTGTGSSASNSYKDAVATESALPTVGNTDGDVRVTLDTDRLWVWDNTTSRWINTGLSSAAAGSTPSADGYDLVNTNISTNRTERQLVLQPADGTHPGIVSTSNQTFAGNKTFTGDIIVDGKANIDSIQIQNNTVSSTDTNGDILLTPDGTGKVQVSSDLTVDGVTNADGGVDVTTLGGTLTVGFTNASTINIGRSGASINIIGSTTYEQVTNLDVADKNITVNKGGAAGSASASGLDIEENSSVTGYNRTSSDRNSWELKAPNTAGIAVITPGSGGITLDQSSHNPVTLATVGSSPNANGASLSTQQLTLQPADGTNPGLVTAGTQTIGGNKTFSGTIGASNLSGTNTGDVTITDTNSIDLTLTGQSLSADLRLSGSTLSIDGSGAKLTNTAVSPGSYGSSTNVGSFTVDQQGRLTAASNTNIQVTDSQVASGAAISRAKLASGTAYAPVVNNSSGALNETSPLTNGQVLIGTTGGAASPATLTAGSGISVTNGAGSITVAMSVPTTTGDIASTSFTSTTDVPSNENVTGFSFSNAVTRSFSAHVSVVINATSTLYANYRLEAIQKGSSWAFTEDYVGDATGVTFNVSNTGQVQWSKATTSGFTSAVITFRAITNGV